MLYTYMEASQMRIGKFWCGDQPQPHINLNQYQPQPTSEPEPGNTPGGSIDCTKDDSSAGTTKKQHKPSRAKQSTNFVTALTFRQK